MKFFERQPLRYSIPVFLILLFIVASSLTWKYYTTSINCYLEQEGISKTKNLLNKAQGSVNHFYLHNDLEGLQEETSALGLENNLQLAFIADPQNKILFSTQLSLTEKNLLGVLKYIFAEDFWLQNNSKTKQSMTCAVELSSDRLSVFGLCPIATGNTEEHAIRPNKLGSLFIQYNLLAPKQIRQSHITRLFWLNITSIFLVALCLWIFLYFAINTRVQKLIVAAQKSAAGEKNVRLNFLGNDEFKKIADSLDHLNRQRDTAELELQKAHDELERRVEARTEELKATYKRLIHAEKLSAIGTFSATIAHEFKNPLMAITNVFKGIKQRAPLGKADVDLADIAIDECNRMKDLIKNLQDFYRPTTGEFILVDIHSIIDSILFFCQDTLLQRGFVIEKNYLPDLPPVTVIPDQIKQVFLNLINNAIEASAHHEPTLKITTEATKENIMIRIQDNGKGMSPKILSHIFDPFFTTKTESKGTGLGLSLTSEIIKSHGGEINVKSNTESGTTFFIILPIKRIL